MAACLEEEGRPRFYAQFRAAIAAEQVRSGRKAEEVAAGQR
jgi:hypothetical protein